MVTGSMVGQQPQRRCRPCRLIIFFVCTSVAFQANLGRYHRVLKHLHKCEDIDVLRQAGMHLLRSNIAPAGGGARVLRDIRVLRLLQHSPKPIQPECTGICILAVGLSRLCTSRLTAGGSLTSCEGRKCEPGRPIGICWMRRAGAIDDNIIPTRPPTTAQSLRDQKPLW